MKLKIGDAGFLFVSTLIVNAGNYLINLILGRVLGPELFSEAGVIATSVLMLSFFAVGIQLCTAKFTAGYYATDDNNMVGVFNNWFNNIVFRVGLIISISIIVMSGLIRNFLNFQSAWPIIIIGLGIPFYFSLSIKRGWTQGTDKFKFLAFTYLFEMILRFVFTFGLLFFVLKILGSRTSEAVSLGFFFSFLAAVWIKLPVKKDKSQQIDVSTVRSFIFIIIIYEFSQILINNSDVFLAKHFFESFEAGLYTAIALIGRIVFFGTWTIVTILFPKVIQREKKGEAHLSLFWISFGVISGFGILVTLSCYFIPEVIINILFGKAYLPSAEYLWKYAVATSLFSSANVFAYYYMSLNKFIPVCLSVIAGVVQVVMIFFFHESIEQIILVQIILMSGLLLCMLLYQGYEEITARHNFSRA